MLSLGDLPVHDTELCMRLLDGDEELFAELVDLYRDNTEKVMKTLFEAADEGDLEGVANAAHAIKGSSANLGIERVREVSYRLETAGREGNVEPISELVDGLRTEFQRFISEVCPHP